MGKIYVGQSKLRLQLNTGVTIESGDVLWIKYCKPGSSSVEVFVAEELGTPAGAIYYDFDIGDLDTAGIWKFWAYIIFNDGREAPGESISIRIYNEGN